MQKKRKKLHNTIKQPLKDTQLIRSIPVKAGRPVWQTVSCTLKAKVVVSNGHWERAKQKRPDWTTRFPIGMWFLQLLHVETGNVLTDMQSTARIKHVKPEGQSAVEHWRIKHLILFKPQQIIARVFWLQSEWFRPQWVFVWWTQNFHHVVPS